MTNQPEKKKNTLSKLRTLAIVLVTFGLLACLIIPNFTRCRCGNSITACKSNLKNLGTGMEMYSMDWNGHYPRNLDMLVPNYLKTIPECPAAGRVTYRADFGPKAPGNTSGFADYYSIECTGHSHADINVPPDYPKYNGIEGIVRP
jgi:competence protein ComGC